MIIGERCFREVKDDLVIENYLNLEKIIVKKGSFMNLNSLKICNNEKLKTIEIEDGEDWNSVFYEVKNVIIESISIIFLIFSDLSNLQSFITGYDSFCSTIRFSLLSNFY